MSVIDEHYKELLQVILDFGVEKKDRTGTGTKSIFGYTIRHNMQDGFPLLTTKKMAWKSIVVELLWFLKGDTNIKYLIDNGCHIWDGDAYKNYVRVTSKEIEKNPELLSKEGYGLTEAGFVSYILNKPEFAKKWGELGPIYGAQWRKWDGIDQIQELITTLKTNPDSRRMLVSAWNVNYLDEMVLPPCHYGFQVYTREKEGMRYISLMWNQRSVDTFLGLPFNIASYALLLIMIADEVNMIPDELIGNLGDCHLYLNHIEQAKEQIERTSFPSPTVFVRDGINCSSPSDVILKDYVCHPAIKAPLSN